MYNFKKFLRNKFTWAPDDVEHEKDKQKPVDRKDRFIWKKDDVEHHDLTKESLDEKLHIGPEFKGHHDNPHKIEHSSWSHNHPHGKANEPNDGSDEHMNFADHHDSLDDDEKDSVRYYKGSGYEEINSHLRGQPEAIKKFKKEHQKKLEKENNKLKFKQDDNAHLKDGEKKDWHSHDDDDHDEDDDDHHQDHDIQQHIHNLDHVTSNKTTEGHTVYRGGHPGDRTKFPIGHEFTDHGYSSTSFRKSVASGFAKNHKTHNGVHKEHIHVLHLKPGTKGHYFDVHGEDSDHSNHEEKEFVLHRGTRFKVTHHSEDENAHYIHTRVVKQGVRVKANLDKIKAKEGQPKDSHGLPGQNKFPFMKHHKRFK